ncbi:MAG: acyltransferase [Proteobacteria bacterium]|nr:acyltransferase [Pseudomonadota bacterium]
MLQSKFLTENDLSDFGFRKLGKNVRISEDVRIYGPENISIGDNVRIHDFATLSAVNGFINIGSYIIITRGCNLSGTFGITMHDFSSMAANTVVYSGSDDYSGRYMTGQLLPKEYTNVIGGPVVIGRHVIIGSASTIIGKVEIAEGCSIGAMSLVIKDTDPWGIYVGIPAKRVKDRQRDLLELEKKFLEEKFLKENKR